MLLRTCGNRAVASLVQKEFFFPSPSEPGAPVNALWDVIVAENKGQTCTFVW